jgi:hypothetical protein
VFDVRGAHLLREDTLLLAQHGEHVARRRHLGRAAATSARDSRESGRAVQRKGKGGDM